MLKRQHLQYLLSVSLSILLFCGNSFALATEAQTTEAAPAKQQQRLWNLRNIDIRTVIDEVSRETGKNFIVDPRVEGKLTIISSTPMPPEQVYQVFLSGLQVLGYAAVPSGDAIKIIPDIAAKQFATPVASGIRPGQGDEVVVRVIAVHHVPAVQLVPVLRPLLPQWGNVSAYAPSNMLILSGHANNLQRLNDIISRVDTPSNDSIDLLPLKHASAQDIVNTIQSLQTANKSTQNQHVTIAADDRSNSVLLSGNKQARLRLRVLISQLDTPTGANGNTQVLYLRYLKAKDLVPVLAGVAKSNYGGPVATVIGTRSSGNSTTSNNNINNNSQAANFLDTSSASKVEIIAEPNTNSIIINAPPTLMRTLKVVIAKLDIRPAQVLVEALIAEISEDDLNRLGIDWGTLVSEAAGITPTGFQAGIGIIRKDKVEDFQAIITALATNNKADIVSTPSIVVLDNHEAKIEVGKKVSIQDSSYPNNANGTTTATPYSTFSRENVALHLNVKPQINRGNSVELEIDHANDTLANPNDASTTPIVNTSAIKTSVIVNSGDLLVLGGLIQNQIQDETTKLPILGDIPGVGKVFHKKIRSRSKKNLMVFLRPVILHDRQTSLQVTGGKYQFIRNEQLHWLRKHNETSSKDNVLPSWGKSVQLPLPFSDK